MDPIGKKLDIPGKMEGWPRCQVVGCPTPSSAGLLIGTVAGFELYAKLCTEHAREAAALAESAGRSGDGLD